VKHRSSVPKENIDIKLYRVAQKSKPPANDHKIALKPVCGNRFIVKWKYESSTI